jgi:Domain of unknown function (DUF6458)
MKTATGLFLIAVGAVLAFAVNGHPWFLNLQVCGWILMVLGVVGLVLPRRSYGWLRRQMVVKRAPDGQPVAWTRQRRTNSNPPYMVLNPAATAEGTAADFDRAAEKGTPVVPAAAVPPQAVVPAEELIPEEEVVEEYFPE